MPNLIKSMRRRSVLLAAPVLAAITLLPIGAAAEKAVMGGTVVASIDFQPKSLDPIFGDSDTADRYLANQMFETLVKVGADGKLQPFLATSWEYSEDGTEIILNLREGVVFHDGTPFNAEAVVFNLNRVANPDTKSGRAQDVTEITSVEALDELTVKITLKAPSVVALASLAAEGGYMGSPTAILASGDDYGRNPVGTGPFKFVGWPGGERIVMNKFDEYWGKDEAGRSLPYLDEVIVRVVRQASVAGLELEAGTIHLANSIPVRDAKRLSASESLELLPPRLLTHIMVAMNTQNPKLSDDRVRRALAQAFDREQLSLAIGQGEGSVTPVFIAPNEDMFNDELEPWGYNPESAKALLQEAGIDRLEIGLAVIQREPDVQIAQIMQAQAAAAGVDLTLEVLDRQAWLDKVRVEKTFDAAMLRASFPKLDTDKVFTFYLTPGRATNYSLQENSEIAALIESARSELDVEARRAIYTEISQILIDQAYFAHLFNFPSMNVVNSAVQNVGQDVSGAWFFRETWLAE